jgi:hypothetical protein
MMRQALEMSTPVGRNIPENVLTRDNYYIFVIGIGQW